MRVHSRVNWISLALSSLIIGCSGSSKVSSGAGGSAAVGGTDATGGISEETGGSGSAGGSSAVDESSGGSSATGGTADTSIGGSAGGQNAVLKCVNLPVPAGSAAVARPSGTAGELKVVNWAGYTGAVSFTFDDQTSSQLAAYPTLNALGVKYTFYVVSGWGLSNSNLKQAVVDGHEIGNHTSNHSSTITADAIDTCTTEIKSQLGVTPYTFAAPNGTNGSSGWEQYAKTRFIIDRGVANGLMMPNDSTDQWNTPCYIPPASAPTDTMNKEILAAQTGGGWKVVLVHGFTGSSDGAYLPVVLSDFTATVEYAKSLGNLWLDTVRNIGSYWIGQKVLTKAAATTSGTDTVYSWDWPAFYPPDTCVRVTVAGGTLKQNGVPLQWDPHGYYEVSLNAGSLTLSP